MFLHIFPYIKSLRFTTNSLPLFSRSSFKLKTIFSLYISSYFKQRLCLKAEKTAENQENLVEKTIILTKKEYFMKIVGNNKDFFFFIVFQEENQETFEEAQQIARVLQKNLTLYMPNQENVVVYMIERAIYNDIKKTINRVKNAEINEKTNIYNPIDIYFKTPFSGNPAYIKYKQSSFYTEKTQKRLFKLIKKLRNPVEIIDDSDEFLRKLHYQTLNKLNSPLIIKVIPEGSNEKNHKRIKKTAFYCFERKILPLQSNFVILMNTYLINSFGLQNNEVYIMRNDIISKYKQCIDNSAGNEYISNNNGDLIIEDLQRKNQYILEKYSIFHKEMLENEKNLLNEIKEEKKKEFNVFLNFLLPQVFLINNTKTKTLIPFFKKVNFNNKKPTLSFFLTEDEIENKTRLINFMKLFQLFKNNFHFVIMESSQTEEMFPHVNKNYPRFCVFNFFNQNKNLNKYKNYHKKLIYPYEKYYLSDDENFFESFEKLKEKCDLILKNQAANDYISNINDVIEDINSDILNSKFDKNHSFIVELYDHSVLSEFSKGVFLNIYDDLSKNIQFFRMNGLNDSENFVNIRRFPAYLMRVKGKTYVYHPNFKEIDFKKKKLEEVLRKFILERNTE